MCCRHVRPRIHPCDAETCLPLGKYAHPYFRTSPNPSGSRFGEKNIGREQPFLCENPRVGATLRQEQLFSLSFSYTFSRRNRPSCPFPVNSEIVMFRISCIFRRGNVCFPERRVLRTGLLQNARLCKCCPNPSGSYFS